MASMREQQDWEYEQCVLADMEKQFQKHNAEELRRVLQDSLNEERRVQQDRWNEERRMKAARMSQEPGAQTPNQMTIVFRMKMPSGNTHRMARRFCHDNTVQDILDFADCLDSVPTMGTTRVCTNIPVIWLEPCNTTLHTFFKGAKEASLILEILR